MACPPHSVEVPDELAETAGPNRPGGIRNDTAAWAPGLLEAARKQLANICAVTDFLAASYNSLRNLTQSIAPINTGTTLPASQSSVIAIKSSLFCGTKSRRIFLPLAMLTRGPIVKT